MRHRGVAPATLDDVQPVLDVEELRQARYEVDSTGVSDEVVAYVASVVRETRTLPSVELGASPRAGVHLLAAARAHARLDERGFVTPDDVAAVAHAVLRHRLILHAEAELERYRPDDAVEAVLQAVPVPR
jgi:MoxR-like ATPase